MSEHNCKKVGWQTEGWAIRAIEVTGTNRSERGRSVLLCGSGLRNTYDRAMISKGRKEAVFDVSLPSIPTHQPRMFRGELLPREWVAHCIFLFRWNKPGFPNSLFIQGELHAVRHAVLASPCATWTSRHVREKWQRAKITSSRRRFSVKRLPLG